MDRMWIGRLAVLALVTTPAALADGKKSCEEFEELTLTLERNQTDGDTEVVLFALGQDEGLKSLVITAPGGRRAATIHAQGRGVGLREFLLESAEPPDLDLVLGSFPQGEYLFEGRTVGGDCLRGTSLLSHEIAPATTLLQPEEDEVVAPDAIVLEWAPVADAERYVVELNSETSGSEFTFEVFPPTTSLAIPASLIEPGAEYQFGVGVRTEVGNLTVVELTFFTE